MTKCSICEKEGHNKRKCTANVKTNIQKSNLSTISSTKPDIRETYPQSQIAAIKLKENALKDTQGELIRKLDQIPKTHLPKIQVVSNFCKGCHKSEHKGDEACPGQSTVSRYDKTCSKCGQRNHNVKTCPQLATKREKEKAEKEEGPASWLIYRARERFRKGPTEKDGPGFIYIYTYLNPKTEEDKNVFKIGMSKKEDGKRRVDVQETKNKEKYRVIFHEETPLRKLSENVIHLHLKAVRAPRDSGDGRTEWFQGNVDNFLRVTKDVIKEVKFAVKNKVFEDRAILP